MVLLLLLAIYARKDQNLGGSPPFNSQWPQFQQPMMEPLGGSYKYSIPQHFCVSNQLHSSHYIGHGH